VKRGAKYFIATFKPAAHWSAAIRLHDGLRCAWRRAWIIEQGPHASEWACIPSSPTKGPCWAPESELVERGMTTQDMASF
jgi:hypothetical protein